MLVCFALLAKWWGCWPICRVSIWWESCRRCEDRSWSSLSSYLDKMSLRVNKNCLDRCCRLLKCMTINQSLKKRSVILGLPCLSFDAPMIFWGNLEHPIRNMSANFSTYWTGWEENVFVHITIHRGFGWMHYLFVLEKNGNCWDQIIP